MVYETISSGTLYLFCFVFKDFKCSVALTIAETLKFHIRPLIKSVYQNIIFLFRNQNICCGYSKEPFQ